MRLEGEGIDADHIVLHVDGDTVDLMITVRVDDRLAAERARRALAADREG